MSAHRPASSSRPLGGTRGAVLVEHLMALLPVTLMSLATWQRIELWTADSILRRAAGAAARAAIVVLPDDPAFYGGAPVDEFTGARKTAIELAASLVLAASPHFAAKPLVQVAGAHGRAPLTLTVSVPIHCYPAWLRPFCGARVLSAEATLPYQGATYRY